MCDRCRSRPPQSLTRMKKTLRRAETRSSSSETIESLFFSFYPKPRSPSMRRVTCFQNCDTVDERTQICTKQNSNLCWDPNHATATACRGSHPCSKMHPTPKSPFSGRAAPESPSRRRQNCPSLRPQCRAPRPRNLIGCPE